VKHFAFQLQPPSWYTLEQKSAFTRTNDGEIGGLDCSNEGRPSVLEGERVGDLHLEVTCDWATIAGSHHSPSTSRVRWAIFSVSKSVMRFRPAAASFVRSALSSLTSAAVSAACARSRS